MGILWFSSNLNFFINSPHSAGVNPFRVRAASIEIPQFVVAEEVAGAAH
jgi:hypothetical protein